MQLQCVSYSGECPSVIIECCFLYIHVWVVSCDKSFTLAVNLPDATLLYPGLGTNVKNKMFLSKITDPYQLLY